MSFLRLPSEIQLKILEHTLYEIGLRKFIWLRNISRIFNKHIPEVVYGLPTFSTLEEGSIPLHLTWDLRMSKEMTVGLILSRLRNQPESRGLSFEIQQTAQLASSLRIGKTLEYTTALTNLAAEFLPLSEIIRRLVARPCTVCKSSLLNNALAAALYLSKTSDVKSLLGHGAEICSQYGAFGEPLVVAACYADIELFLFVAHAALRVNDADKRRLATSRLLIALSSAATINRTDIFCDGTCALLEGARKYGPEHIAYALVLRSALVSSSTEVITALLGWLKDESSRKQYVRDGSSWLEIMRLACLRDHHELLSLGFEYTNALEYSYARRALLEDASMAGNINMIHGIGECHVTDVDRNDAIYWTTRNLRWQILNDAAALQCVTKQNVLSAMSGASRHGKEGVFQALNAIKSMHTSVLAKTRDNELYCDLVDAFVSDIVKHCGRKASIDDPCFVQEQPSKSEASHEDPLTGLLPLELEALQQACSIGDIVALSCGFKGLPCFETWNERAFAGCFSAAIRAGDVSIVHYLYTKLPRHRSYPVDAALEKGSMAIFQLMLDHGWTINTACSPTKPPPLAYVAQSERLTRWFLDHGADPNQRCDWDITPLSVAIRVAPLSTIFLMLRCGGDVRKGQVLHFAVERQGPGQLAIIDRLLACGALINARMFENDPASWLQNRPYGMGTPLQKAVELGMEDVVRLLLSRGADRMIQDSVGRTAYSLAMASGNETIAQLVKP